jgi:hypothetical protein
MSTIKTVAVFAIVGAVLVNGVKSQRDADVESDRTVLPVVERGVRMVAADFDPKITPVPRDLKGFSLGTVKIARSPIAALLQQVMAGGDRTYDVYASFQEDGADKCATLELKWKAQPGAWSVIHQGAGDRCDPVW